ncbi:MAG: excinuclease ABC subunit UvrB [Bacteroidota bacterium]|nr:excinuclease ABC subunit UvrB [Candidatus Kapabacteria bacterium]MCS7302149.1 excinuclease ABC subunit UvrB [Candidatus Kapabacteria bacterium]MDW8074298.1 excinuclease ABC subunit UvrB [Bacteroidota bacterium]MDW8271226.1 excinuclease ABC subunit UvrB [Bacteroidota bacterium]
MAQERKFELVAPYQPAGDQPKAIAELVAGLEQGVRFQTLLGVTGSGKTFTMSNVIARVQRPTLVISPNKTLAAQLFGEFKSFFPNNAVEFFISYYDYYQPEAYIPSTDTYIEKDIAINDEIDRLRLRATSALVEGRRDVIIVASVSCIYGIGSKDEFAAMIFPLHVGMSIKRKHLLERLNELLFTRNDSDLGRACYRVRGDIIDVVPAYEDEVALRIELWDDTIERLSLIRLADGKILESYESYTLYPARQFITTRTNLQRAIQAIKDELYHRLKELNAQGKYVEAQRLEQRTLYDLEMLKEVGYCSGIENYSMHLSGRTFGERPTTLIDYFPQDYLLIIDESHVTIPQIRAMYNGDRHRKEILVEYGFRLPSALENRPLRFEEFESLINQVIFVSATPGEYELEKCKGVVVEQIIRPTGLLDPRIEVRPVRNQIDDLLKEIHTRVQRQQRVLVTTLTKRMAEDLAEYLSNLGIKVAYIHSEIDALNRVEIIRKLRLGEFDVLVGVNLLREGLDMPEVALVAILDADKEGFLRSERSLLQIAGRTARNEDGTVILYADTITQSIQRVIEETNRRRRLQQEYNRAHGINPRTIYKSLEEILQATTVADVKLQRQKLKQEAEALRRRQSLEPLLEKLSRDKIEQLIGELFVQMKEAARDLDFERAAQLRDEIQRLQLALQVESSAP